MAKSNAIITPTIAEDGGSITFTVKDAGSFTFELGRVSEAAKRRAVLHGFVQRISDGGAMSRDTDTGLPATPEAKLARMQAIADHYMTGTEEWSMTRAAGSGGGKRFDVGAVVVALIESGKATDVDTANGLIDRLATKRNVERTDAAKAWAQVEDVAVAMARIAARKASAKVGDLMAEIA